MQKDAVGQYERALQQASDKLQECYARQGDYAQRLEEAKTRQAQLKQEVASAAATYKQYRGELGETDSATIAARSNLDLAKEEYRQQTAEVRKLTGQQVSLQKSTQNAADAFTSAQTKLNNARAAVKKTAAEITACGKALRLAQTSWEAAGQSIASGNAVMPDRINTPFTNEHFASFCLSMLGQPYWYGTALHKCSESLRASKARQYPSHYGSNRTSRYRQDIANKKVCADCMRCV